MSTAGPVKRVTLWVRDADKSLRVYRDALGFSVLEDKLQGYGELKRIVSADDDGNITMKALSDIAAKRTQARTFFGI